jgi:hypothetical protein
MKKQNQTSEAERIANEAFKDARGWPISKIVIEKEQFERIIQSAIDAATAEVKKEELGSETPATMGVVSEQTGDPYWTIKDPEGRLVHTVISCEKDDAIKEWVETEELPRMLVNARKAKLGEKQLPDATWEEFEQQGYSVVQVYVVAKDDYQDLQRLIGQPPEGSHPDEWKPRGATWHQERLNWQAEVERLRANQCH